MRFNLRGIGIELQPQRLDESSGKGFPVKIRIRHQMRVVAAHRTIQLAQHGHTDDGVASAHQACRDIGHLLAQGGRRRRLPVRARQHGGIGMRVRQRAQPGDEFIKSRQQRRVARGSHCQRVSKIVDVFRGAGEMNELGRFERLGIVPHPLLQPVFDGLHIMIGLGLDGLDALAVGSTELIRQPL